MRERGHESADLGGFFLFPPSSSSSRSFVYCVCIFNMLCLCICLSRPACCLRIYRGVGASAPFVSLARVSSGTGQDRT